MKNGAPHNEVNTPTGTSSGENTVRARTSIKIKKNAPPIALAGINFLCDGPTINRSTCGIINPTKPIEPASDTLAPTSNEEEKTKVVSRVQPEFQDGLRLLRRNSWHRDREPNTSKC